jgi:hypothetical protein
LSRFDCDDKALKDKEVSKPSTDTKGFSHFRPKATSNSTSAVASALVNLESKNVVATPVDSAHPAHSKVLTRSSSNPIFGSISADVAPLVSAVSSERDSSTNSLAIHASRGISRISSFDAHEAHGVADTGTTPLLTLKATTDARINAVEARTSHLQTQLDRMLALMEQKDQEIEGRMFIASLRCAYIAQRSNITGKLADIERLRQELKVECSSTQDVRRILQHVLFTV